MSQSQQQREPSTITESKNKKKKYKKKLSDKNLKVLISGKGEDLEGAGDGILAKAANTKEKRPLITSMEDLQVSNSTTPVVSRKVAGSNWEAMVKKQENLVKHAEKNNVAANDVENVSKPALTRSAIHRQKRKAAELKYLAMDCEMVGVGVNGQDDMLARVSIVNKRGEVLLDKFVKPRDTVTDYRTCVSGIRPNDILNGDDFIGVQNEVIQLLQGKILVGHAISNDLAVLHIKHPYKSIRDTARYKPLCRLVANGRTPSLKRLSQAILGKEIQIGEHNSVEDARAAMSIYNLLASDWEMYIKRHQHK